MEFVFAVLTSDGFLSLIKRMDVPVLVSYWYAGNKNNNFNIGWLDEHEDRKSDVVGGTKKNKAGVSNSGVAGGIDFSLV